MLLDATGHASTFKLTNDGAVRKGTQGKANIKLKKPGKQFSALAGIDNSSVLVAVDGAVVRLKRTGNDWTEQSRFKDTFSPECKLAVAGDRVYISEKEPGLRVFAKEEYCTGQLTIDTRQSCLPMATACRTKKRINACQSTTLSNLIHLLVRISMSLTSLHKVLYRMPCLGMS